MAFESIRTFEFRNLVDGEVRTDAPEIFLVGENGQGKTNFLEAVYFCSFASSFRVSKDTDLVKSGSRDCSALAELTNSIKDKILVKIEDGKKKITIDGKRVDDRKNLLEIVPSVVFCHEDMDFVAGPPEKRRWFFDQSLSLYDPGYLDDLRKYRKILKTRNTLIKEGRSSVFDVIDAQMATYGIEVMKRRTEAAHNFSKIFGPLYENVSGITGISIQYAPSWKNEDFEKVMELLKGRRESDISFGTTLTGPHRDRYVYMRDGYEFASRASTGQRRLLALLLRAAQSCRYYESTGRKPVLLLDDVLLELDPEKRRRFLEVLPKYEQAFFTFLPEEPYDRYRKDQTVVYHVVEGRLIGE